MLLAIYAGSQVASTYFMGATMDKTQRTIMMVLPLVFLTVVSRFPTGLVLYWMTTNLWTVGQGLITRRLMPKPGAALARPTGPRRSSRTPPQRRRRSPRTTRKAEPQPKPPPAQPRRVKQEEGRRAPVSREVTVEATGETVGEAKWKALRDLERLAPGARQGEPSGSRSSSEGERGLLGVGYTPARVVAIGRRAGAPSRCSADA